MYIFHRIGSKALSHAALAICRQSFSLQETLLLGLEDLSPNHYGPSGEVIFGCPSTWRSYGLIVFEPIGLLGCLHSQVFVFHPWATSINRPSPLSWKSRILTLIWALSLFTKVLSITSLEFPTTVQLGVQRCF